MCHVAFVSESIIGDGAMICSRGIRAGLKKCKFYRSVRVPRKREQEIRPYLLGIAGD